jgi:ABC-type transporter Mla MlaB component
VTLRITVREHGSRRHLALAGRLTREEVGELKQAVASDPDACLDLEELRSADAAGLAALRSLRAEGLEMCGMPPHLAWRIDDDETQPP